MSETASVENPYTYLGYRYDKEAGLYYLQSRYVLQLSGGDAQITLQLEEQDIRFIFGNKQLDGLLAIEIYATKDYDARFLIGDEMAKIIHVD
ncbi:hypothetical protein IC620_14265 [Hazenella sp. IB182357]|uniref:Uncharacterized protein n=1 Tax=Polycladospora coralii TaxID=2771432 RepID=A0A926RU38_9BACL|nr:hypothetical protein [Polycladospora coralii]MBD1373515.1 hypothetical protein [Polycladospora coralii]